MTKGPIRYWRKGFFTLKEGERNVLVIEIHQGRGLRRLEEKSNQTFYNWIERMIVVLFEDKSTQVVQGGFQSGWCIF